MEIKEGNILVLYQKDETIYTVQIDRVICPVKGLGHFVHLKEGNLALVVPDDAPYYAKAYFVPWNSRHEDVAQKLMERIDKVKYSIVPPEALQWYGKGIAEMLGFDLASPYKTDKSAWFILPDEQKLDFDWFNIGGSDPSGKPFSEDKEDDEG